MNFNLIIHNKNCRAIATLLTVGYGDIRATNEIEAMFCIVTILLGCLMFAFNINVFGSIISDIFKNKKE